MCAEGCLSPPSLNDTLRKKGVMCLDKYRQAVLLWQSYRIDSPAALDKYLASFRVLFAFHSGRIENKEVTYHDTREIFENGRILNFTGNPRTVLEQQNQKLCYEALKQRIVSKESMSIALIKDMHAMLTGGTYDEHAFITNEERPGEFKKHDYVTGVLEVGSPAEHVEQEMADLIREVNEYKGDETLKAAAYLHARFEYIHPFADGNGRVGRTLMNYYLMINDHPPLIVYDEDKYLYYECLQKYDETENLDSLHEFLKYQTEKTWDKALALAGGAMPEHKRLADYF